MDRFLPRLVSLCFTCLMLCEHTSARADEAKESHRDPWERSTAIWGHAGRGPFGAIGTSLEFAPVHWLPIEVGAGIVAQGSIVDPKLAARLGLWPRLRIPFFRGLAIGVGPFISFGNYQPDAEKEVCFDCQDKEPRAKREWDPAVFGGALLSLEGRVPAGFVWRAYGGAGTVLNRDAMLCTPAPGESTCSLDGVLPQFYLAASFGYAFE